MKEFREGPTRTNIKEYDGTPRPPPPPPPRAGSNRNAPAGPKPEPPANPPDRNRADSSAKATTSEGAFVPAEPTREMKDAGEQCFLERVQLFKRANVSGSAIDFWQSVGYHPGADIYAAMLASAPTPPASIPAAEVQALVERMRDEASAARRDGRAGTATGIEMFADELAKLARGYAPEVSQKPPSPRNPE